MVSSFVLGKHSLVTNRLPTIVNNSAVLQWNPTGGILHIHDSTLTPLEFLIADASYRENLYICSSPSNDFVSFVFAPSTPADPADPAECHWELVSERRSREGALKFDAFLRSQFSLCTDNPTGDAYRNWWIIYYHYLWGNISRLGSMKMLTCSAIINLNIPFLSVCEMQEQILSNISSFE